MATPIYTVHRNVDYEFGQIHGVFVSADAAIEYAKSLDISDEITVSRWSPSDDAADQNETVVWHIRRGKVEDCGKPVA